MIPAGIQPGEFEFGWIKEDGFVMQEGQKVPVRQMRPELKPIIDRSMNKKHHEAWDNMGIFDQDERRIQFLKCNCSSWDFTPDLVNGKLQLEYVKCDKRGICSEEGRGCQPLIIDGETITMTELRVISQTRKGLYDKEICDIMNITPSTLRTHRQNIERKLKASRKVQVALKAVEYGII